MLGTEWRAAHFAHPQDDTSRRKVIESWLFEMISAADSLALGVALIHCADNKTATGCHGRVPRGFESQGNVSLFRRLVISEKWQG